MLFKSMETDLDENSEICDFCHIGRISEKRLTYTERFQEELIVIPDIPAKVCDYCGEKQYDPLVMNTLHRLLWTNLKKAKERRNGPANYTYPIDPQARLNKGHLPPDEQ